MIERILTEKARRDITRWIRQLQAPQAVDISSIQGDTATRVVVQTDIYATTGALQVVYGIETANRTDFVARRRTKNHQFIGEAGIHVAWDPNAMYESIEQRIWKPVFPAKAKTTIVAIPHENKPIEVAFQEEENGHVRVAILRPKPLYIPDKRNTTHVEVLDFETEERSSVFYRKAHHAGEVLVKTYLTTHF